MFHILNHDHMQLVGVTEEISGERKGLKHTQLCCLPISKSIASLMCLRYHMFKIIHQHLILSKVPKLLKENRSPIRFLAQACTDINIITMCWYVSSDFFSVPSLTVGCDYFVCLSIFLLPLYQKRYQILFLSFLYLYGIKFYILVL